MLKKFPTFRQMDSADCGPTCLRMITRFYGRNFELHKLREYCYANNTGVSLLGISDAAERIGFRTNSVKSSFERFVDKGVFPCIVLWREDHFVVVYQVKVKKDKEGHWKGQIHVADPAFGLVAYSVEEFLDGWITDKVNGQDKGIFLLLVPTLSFFEPKEEGAEEHKFKLINFFQYVKPYKKLFIQVILGMILSLGFSFIFPFLSQTLVDKGIMNNNLNFVYLVLGAQLILSISEMIVGYFQSWILLHVTSRISIALISDFLSKMLKLPISFFDSKKTGDIMQRIGDHSRIQSFFTGTTIGTFFSFLNFFIFSIVLGYYNLTILGIFVAGHTLYVIWVLLFLKVRRELDFKNFDKASRNQSSLIEIIQGAQEVKLSGCEVKMRNKWESIQSELFLLGVKNMKISQIQSVGAFFFSNTTNVILSVFSAYLVINGEISLGMMMSLSYIIGQLKGPVGAFIGFVHSYQDAKYSLERLGEVYSQEDEDQANEHRIPELNMSDRNIYIKELSFSYMGDKVPPVLKDITLTIPHNKTTAIVGESGSGKTTLIKLLLGYYQPTKGELFLGNVNFRHIDTRLWRSQCAAVMQEGFIFSTTIAENISISDKYVDKDRLYYATKLANIHDFITEMPSNYNTKIGAEGSGVSQGQKQRILIARAIYKNPSFLFFDEATNALDANNELVITENLKEFYKDRTAVIVAHRLSTVKHADQIVVLQNGHIAEIGTHDSLLQKQGAYYNLVKNQLELN